MINTSRIHFYVFRNKYYYLSYCKQTSYQQWNSTDDEYGIIINVFWSQVLDLYSPQPQSSGGDSPPLNANSKLPKNDKKALLSNTPPASVSPGAAIGKPGITPIKNGSDKLEPPKLDTPIRYNYPPYPQMPYPVYSAPPPNHTSIPPPPRLSMTGPPPSLGGGMYSEPPPGPPSRFPPVNVPPPNYFPPLPGPPPRPYYPPP